MNDPLDILGSIDPDEWAPPDSVQDDSQRVIQIGLTVLQAVRLRTAAKAFRRKAIREDAKSTFIPEEGKFDSNKSRIEHYSQIIDLLDFKLKPYNK